MRRARCSYTERLLGVSRYVTNPDRTTCEFALVVADDFAGQGLGARLMLSIMEVARDKGLERYRRAGADQQPQACSN